MNWAQFKGLVSHTCLAGAVVASWSVTQEVAGSIPFTVMTNIFVTEFAEFSKIFRENSTVTRSPRSPACHRRNPHRKQGR